MTTTETYELASRFVAGYGVADCPLAHCAKRLTTFNGGGGYDAPFRLRETTLDATRALQHLSLLSWPDSRHVLFPVGDSCSALISNSRNGSDYADYVHRLASHLGTRCARVVNHPGRVWSNGGNREVLQLEAHIFCLYGADGEVIRSVDCLDDGGRWDFLSLAIVIQSNRPFHTLRDAKGTASRSNTSKRLLPPLGFPMLGRLYSCRLGRYVLFDIPGRPATTCTIAEADDPAYGYYNRGLGYVPYMATHAASVIANFERCLRINPSYEPLVRSALGEAYRLAKQE